jgi:hypothetical protein
MKSEADLAWNSANLKRAGQVQRRFGESIKSCARALKQEKELLAIHLPTALFSTWDKLSAPEY